MMAKEWRDGKAFYSAKHAKYSNKERKIHLPGRI